MTEALIEKQYCPVRPPISIARRAGDLADAFRVGEEVPPLGDDVAVELTEVQRLKYDLDACLALDIAAFAEYLKEPDQQGIFKKGVAQSAYNTSVWEGKTSQSANFPLRTIIDSINRRATSFCNELPSGYDYLNRSRRYAEGLFDKLMDENLLVRSLERSYDQGLGALLQATMDLNNYYQDHEQSFSQNPADVLGGSFGALRFLAAMEISGFSTVNRGLTGAFGRAAFSDFLFNDKRPDGMETIGVDKKAARGFIEENHVTIENNFGGLNNACPALAPVRGVSMETGALESLFNQVIKILAELDAWRYRPGLLAKTAGSFALK